jgi:AraC-like DNA-binding protein
VNVARDRVEQTQPAIGPTVEVVEISDPTAAGEGLEILAQDVVQLEATSFRARRVAVRLADTLVLLLSASHRVRARATLHDQLLAFVVFGPRARGTVNGLDVRPDLILAAESSAQVEFVVEAGYESVTILVSPVVLDAELSARRREGGFHAPRGVELLDATAIHARALFDWGKRLTSTAARRPELFDRTETRAAARAELLEHLLAALDGARGAARTRRELTREAHRRVVEAAERYALANVGDHRRVKDLCLAVGVSERTLQYAFQGVMRMSPIAYLTRLRLHRVRQALRVATRGSTTVADQALEWGFWHFGDFSRAYKACFGELPSETLRRRPPGQATRRARSDVEGRPGRARGNGPRSP